MAEGKAKPTMTASSSQAELCCPCGQPTSLSHSPTTGPSNEETQMMWKTDGKEEKRDKGHLRKVKESKQKKNNYIQN